MARDTHSPTDLREGFHDVILQRLWGARVHPMERGACGIAVLCGAVQGLQERKKLQEPSLKGGRIESPGAEPGERVGAEQGRDLSGDFLRAPSDDQVPFRAATSSVQVRVAWQPSEPSFDEEALRRCRSLEQHRQVATVEPLDDKDGSAGASATLSAKAEDVRPRPGEGPPAEPKPSEAAPQPVVFTPITSEKVQPQRPCLAPLMPSTYSREREEE